MAAAGGLGTVALTAASGCSWTVTTQASWPTSKDIGKGGSNGVDIDVTTTPNCTWTATSNANWITVTSGASGTGSGKVRFSVAKNDSAERDGTLTVAGHTFMVHQND